MYAANARANIKALATAYARAHGMSMEAVSKKFYGHIGFIRNFVSGNGSVSVDKLDNLIDKFREHWPENTPWPAMESTIIPRLRSRDISKTKQIT